MTAGSWSLVQALNPTPPLARSWLRQELRSSEYQSPWLDSLARWIATAVGKILGRANQMAGLASAITVLIAVTVIILLVWVVPKIRRGRVAAATEGAVLEDLRVTARHYRDLAAQALKDGRYDDAVLDGFRAVAKDMSDRGVLDDAPGRTAQEVALALASPFPEHAGRIGQAADLFDRVRYGHRRSSARQAGQVHDLDTELVRARPLPLSAPERLPV